MGYIPCPHPEKVGHPSERRALEVITASRKLRRRHGSPPIRAYLCACGLWHVTSQPLWE